MPLATKLWAIHESQTDQILQEEQMSKTFRTASFIILVILIAALALAGCGSSTALSGSASQSQPEVQSGAQPGSQPSSQPPIQPPSQTIPASAVLLIVVMGILAVVAVAFGRGRTAPKK
jgi:hypothetical protein